MRTVGDLKRFIETKDLLTDDTRLYFRYDDSFDKFDDSIQEFYFYPREDVLEFRNYEGDL